MKFLRLLLVVALYWTLGASAQESTGRMPPGVLQALAQAGIPESSVGIYVQDVQSERPVLALGDDRPLNPASTIKLLTTFAALDQLGPAYQWTTEIYTDGQFQGDTLNGNLIIKGYGDPRLTLENFWLMLRNLRARGVRESKAISCLTALTSRRSISILLSSITNRLVRTNAAGRAAGKF